MNCSRLPVTVLVINLLYKLFHCRSQQSFSCVTADTQNQPSSDIIAKQPLYNTHRPVCDTSGSLATMERQRQRQGE